MDTLISNPDIEEFLPAMAAPLLSHLTAEGAGCCASLTLISPRRAPLTVTAGPLPQEAERELARFTVSPGHTALRRRTPVRIGDTRSDHRWPGYTREVAEYGLLSVLALPVELADDGQSSLTLLSPLPHDFPTSAVDSILRELVPASKVLTLAVRLDKHRVLEQDLRTALTSRTVIDLAVGIVMAQHSLSQESAIHLLKMESQHRNLRLHDLARELVEQLSLRPPRTHFES